MESVSEVEIIKLADIYGYEPYDRNIPMSENAAKIVSTRYLFPGEHSWKDVCQRVARYITSGMTVYECALEEMLDFERHLFLALVNRDFLFNSPTLFNAGSGVDPELLYTDSPTLETYRRIWKEGQENSHNMLSACFVVPVENSIAGIYQALKDAALITKYGGGVGYDFSRLSHQGRKLDSGVGEASGPLSFMQLFDASARAVMQGGRRRAAQMGILRVDHPDLLDFIASKANGDFSFFNISVMITDEFMEAVKNGTSFPLRDPVTGEAVELVDARGVWEEIVHYAWKTGDPGVVFFSTVNRDRFVPGQYIEATNPCGEEPLYPYMSCNLGHVNLSHVVTAEGKIDLRFFGYLVSLGVKALNLVIDTAQYPLEEIEEKTHEYRPIGLGVMGFAHFLFKLGIRYGAPESLDVARFMSKSLSHMALWASAELAERYGSYPGSRTFGGNSVLQDNQAVQYFLSQVQDEALREKIAQYGLYNATWTTCAPTGTVSLIADTSSGIEPVFALDHTRFYIDKNGERQALHVVDPAYLELKGKGIDTTHCVDAAMIPPDEHVLVQAAWQKYISAGVSKTINLPHEATEEEVRQIYDLAYRSGCKGVTVFRDGCKDEQVLYRSADTGKPEDGSHRSDQTGTSSSGGGVPGGSVSGEVCHPAKRPRTTYGATSEFEVACGTLYVTLNFDVDGNPIETFLTTGKSGVCRANVEGLSRMISLALRCGVGKEHIVKQLKGIRCPYCLSKRSEYLSCADATAHFLEECIPVYPLEVGEELAKDIRREVEARSEGQGKEGTCPDCGAVLVRAEGCVSCVQCGFSRCS